MKKKYKKNNNARIEYLQKFSSLINEHKDDLWKPKLNTKFNINKDVNSWFDIKEAINENGNNESIQLDLEKDSNYEVRKCIKVKLNLSPRQSKIFNNWFNAYTKMYNETLKIIKGNIYGKNYICYVDAKNYIKKIRNDIIQCFDNLKDPIINKKVMILSKIIKSKTKGNLLKINLLDYKELRTHLMKRIKKEIINDSELNNESNTKIFSHILDTAIKLACSNYKSALTNFKRGNIKHFRIRYWKYNRKNKIMEIENSFFKQQSICPAVFGKIDATYDNKNFDLNLIEKNKNYKVDCKIQYNLQNNSYYLLVPIKDQLNQKLNENELVSIDLGIRTFATCISEKKAIKIGDDIGARIRTYLKKIDKINSLNDEEIKLKKLEKLDKMDNEEKKILKRGKWISQWKNKKIDLFRRKIKQYVDELHWKTISYLTNNFRNVLVGDLSIKGISKKDKSLNKMTKRIGYSLKFYEFRKRLENKCKSNLIGYKEIDESYTSKMCSNCGNEHKSLNGNKIYECKKCKMVIDRDLNGARGIYIKIYI